MELIRQINKGFMQVRRRTMQVGEKNSQMEESFWQVRGFSLKQVIKKGTLIRNPHLISNKFTIYRKNK
jgi:hypothetical protein